MMLILLRSEMVVQLRTQPQVNVCHGRISLSGFRLNMTCIPKIVLLVQINN